MTGRIVRRTASIILASALLLAALVHTLHHVAQQTCTYWDPYAPASQDAAECVRAKQYRQLEAFLKDPKYDYEAYLLDKLQLFNETLCSGRGPPRKLIVSTWWFTHTGLLGSTAGEEVWMNDVVHAVEEQGFIVLDDYHSARMIHLANALSESIHMVWMNENNIVECISNPHCIAPADYRPAENTTLRHHLNAIPSRALGTIPLWRLFCTTWWGSRPTNAPRPGGHAVFDWSVPYRGGDEVWSFNPLGQRWSITPFPYPGHTWVPISMEEECKKTPIIPQDERTKDVLVLGKTLMAYSEEHGYIPEQWDWDRLLDDLYEEGFASELVATLNPETVQFAPNAIMPPAFTNLGQMEREKFNMVLSGVGVMLGMSMPMISPTPFLALCRGIPVVMPFIRSDLPKPDPKQWIAYAGTHWQHGPISALPEPYVYSYTLGDKEGLANALVKALKNPIQPYVPPDYSTQALRRKVRAMLYYDYETEYKDIRKKEGGVSPRVPSYMIEGCWRNGRCYFGPEPDDYIAD